MLCRLRVRCSLQCSTLRFSAALKQDFAGISGGWHTAAQLGGILCQSCVGLKLPEEEKYEKEFLPDVVENVLILAAKLLDFSIKARVVSIYGLFCIAVVNTLHATTFQ